MHIMAKCDRVDALDALGVNGTLILDIKLATLQECYFATDRRRKIRGDYFTVGVKRQHSRCAAR